MKRVSLKKQIIISAGCTGVIIAILVGILTSGLIDRIYLSKKQDSLVGVFDEIINASKEGNIYDSNFADDFITICERANIACIVIKPTGRVILTTESNTIRISTHLYEALFLEQGRTIVSEDQYIILELTDRERDRNYLVLWGGLFDGNTVFMEIAMDSITNSLNYTKTLVFVFGIILIVFWILVSTIMTVNALREKNARLLEDIKIRDKNEIMRRELISNISHELKTPISLILGYSDGLLDESISDSREKREHYAEVIIDEADRMNNLISKLLELNEIEYGKQQVDMQNINLSRLVAEEIDSLLVLADNADVDIESYCNNEVMILTDEFLARQVIDNYITNAIKYSEYPNRVRVSVIEEGDRVRFVVFNTGVGIPEEELPKIWDKFYKIDKARTRELNSSGIGLSVVKAAAESLSCDYGVNNIEGGVEFYFTFKKP